MNNLKETETQSGRLNFKKKDKLTLPKGAKVLKKTVETTVEEIENGYLVSKNYDISYTLGKENNYAYFTKKVYFETNPIEVKESKMLADYFK